MRVSFFILLPVLLGSFVASAPAPAAGKSAPAKSSTHPACPGKWKASSMCPAKRSLPGLERRTSLPHMLYHGTCSNLAENMIVNGLDLTHYKLRAGDFVDKPALYFTNSYDSAKAFLEIMTCDNNAYKVVLEFPVIGSAKVLPVPPAQANDLRSVKKLATKNPELHEKWTGDLKDNDVVYETASEAQEHLEQYAFYTAEGLKALGTPKMYCWAQPNQFQPTKSHECKCCIP